MLGIIPSRPGQRSRSWTVPASKRRLLPGSPSGRCSQLRVGKGGVDVAPQCRLQVLRAAAGLGLQRLASRAAPFVHLHPFDHRTASVVGVSWCQKRVHLTRHHGESRHGVALLLAHALFLTAALHAAVTCTWTHLPCLDNAHAAHRSSGNPSAGAGLRHAHLSTVV